MDENDDEPETYGPDLPDPVDRELIPELDVELEAFWESPAADTLAEMLAEQDLQHHETLKALEKSRASPADSQARPGDVEINGKTARIFALVITPPSPQGDRLQVGIFIQAGDLQGLRWIIDGIRADAPDHSALASLLAEFGVSMQVRRWWFCYRAVRAIIRPGADGGLQVQSDPGIKLTIREQEQLDRTLKLIPQITTGRFSLRGAPEGSRGPSKYRPHEGHRFLESLKAAIGDVLDVLDQQRNPFGRVTKKAVSRTLWGEKGDPDTLSRYLTLFGIPFDQTVETMRHARESRLRKSELFSVPALDAPKPTS